MKKLLLLGAIPLSFGLSAQINNYSLEFDGVDDYVEISAGYDTPEKTIYITFNLNTYPTGDMAMLYNAISGISTSSGLNQISIRQDSTLGFGIGGNNNLTGVNTIVPLNQWVNVSFSIGTNNSYIYVDGNLVDSVATGSTPGNSTMDIITFGSFKSNQGLLRFFDGLMNRIAIWNYALDSVEIQDYVNCPPIGNEAGLVGYWDFEEGTGTTATDITVNGNDGALTNSPTWSMDIPAYNCNVGIGELKQENKELVKVVDLMGRETTPQKNMVQIHVYSDGTTERIFEFE